MNEPMRRRFAHYATVWVVESRTGGKKTFWGVPTAFSFIYLFIYLSFCHTKIQWWVGAKSGWRMLVVDRGPSRGAISVVNVVFFNEWGTPRWWYLAVNYEETCQKFQVVGKLFLEKVYSSNWYVSRQKCSTKKLFERGVWFVMSENFSNSQELVDLWNKTFS